jgi:HSP20 family molecular chaperone IbpA
MLTPFRSSVTNPIADPFWNMDVPGLGMDVGFPNIENQLGFPNLPSVQLGMDLTEESDKWVVHADMPGFKDEDVELSIENGMLGVRGTRDKTTESDTGITHRVEVISTMIYNSCDLSCSYVTHKSYFCNCLIAILWRSAQSDSSSEGC